MIIKLSHTIFTSEGERKLEVNETVADGALVCLYGPSGIGKTTLFRVIAGLITPERAYINCLPNSVMWLLCFRIMLCFLI